MSIRKDGKPVCAKQAAVSFRSDTPENLVGRHYFRKQNLVVTKVLAV